MPPSSVVAAASIREYFQEAVASALDLQSFRPNQETISYLIDLLCNFSNASNAELKHALALIIAETQFSLPSQSILQLKQVGDHSLYVSGFFAENLRRSQIDPAYYALLGKIAYRRLSRVVKRTRGKAHLVMVYSELSQEFSQFVEILTDVKNQGTFSHLNVDDLYEKWLREGSEGAAQKLRRRGIPLMKRPGTKQ